MKKLIYIILVGWIVSVNAQGITNTLGGNTENDKFVIENSVSEEGLVVTGEGKVGIGITEPHSNLHVISTSLNGADNTAKFEALGIGSSASHIHYGAKGDWYIRSAASDGKVVIQDSGGNVGIGTSSPDATLNVEGTVKVGVSGLIFNEITELTGTTSGSSSNTLINFPTGYNNTNTRILTCEIYNSYGAWDSLGEYLSAGMTTQIYITHPNNSNFQNRPFRMVLMKVE